MKDPYNSQVLVTTECPSPLLGRDFELWGWLLISVKTKSKKCFSLGYVLYKACTVHPKIFPKRLKSWDQRIPGMFKFVIPIKITLKKTSNFSSRHQYSIEAEAWQGLQPLISKLINYRLLVPCQSPCNTSILPVFKPSGEYTMAQDLWMNLYEMKL